MYSKPLFSSRIKNALAAFYSFHHTCIMLSGVDDVDIIEQNHSLNHERSQEP